MRLNFEIPAPRGKPPAELEIRPREVKAWLASLATAPCVPAARNLLAHVTTLNRSALDPAERLQILELYAPAARALLDGLAAAYVAAELPLTDRAHGALTLARSLAAELALAHKVAADEQAGRLLGLGARKRLPGLLSSQARYLAAIHVASYESYTPVPEGAWRELHQNFLAAQRKGVEREAADDLHDENVLETYVEALLLSLADPYRLVRGEIDRIIAQVRAFRGTVTITRSRPNTSRDAHFVVPCDTDKPPKPALSASDEKSGPNDQILDAGALVEKLNLRRNAIETGHLSATMKRAVMPGDAALLQKIGGLWGKPPKRAHRRESMEATVAICVGLKACVHFVSVQDDGNAQAEADMIRAGITIPLLHVPEDDSERSIQAREWELVNRSAGGIKIRRKGVAMTQAICVGDVVGIRFPGTKRWMLGMARWITSLPESGIEFGIQFLASSARSTWVCKAGDPDEAPQPALIVSGDDDVAGKAALLTAPPVFSYMRELVVEDRGAAKRIRADMVVESSARFSFFEFVVA